MSDNDAYVQLAPDSTGKKIRNIEVETFVNDPTTGKPTLQTVLMQVVSIADEDGNTIDRFIDYDYQQRVLELLTQIRDGIAEIVNHPLGE